MSHSSGRSLSVGDRVRVFGGYDMDPAWLAADAGGYEGRVLRFVRRPGDGRPPAAVVALDRELVLPEGAGATTDPVRGGFLVLLLGHVGTDWATPAPRIHVTLCQSPPDQLPWTATEEGSAWWVESHATYSIIS